MNLSLSEFEVRPVKFEEVRSLFLYLFGDNLSYVCPFFLLQTPQSSNCCASMNFNFMRMKQICILRFVSYKIELTKKLRGDRSKSPLCPPVPLPPQQDHLLTYDKEITKSRTGSKRWSFSTNFASIPTSRTLH